jgi:hypothetical protein
VKNRTIAILIMLYVLIGIFTYSHVYQRVKPFPQMPGDREMMLGFFAGLLWPVYWVGKFSFQLTGPGDALLGEKE